jgi:hypothetical protein
MEAVAEFDRLEFEAVAPHAQVTLFCVEHPSRWAPAREGQQRLVALALTYLRRSLG